MADCPTFAGRLLLVDFCRPTFNFHCPTFMSDFHGRLSDFCCPTFVRLSHEPTGRLLLADFYRTVRCRTAGVRRPTCLTVWLSDLQEGVARCTIVRTRMGITHYRNFTVYIHQSTGSSQTNIHMVQPLSLRQADWTTGRPADSMHNCVLNILSRKPTGQPCDLFRALLRRCII